MYTQNHDKKKIFFLVRIYKNENEGSKNIVLKRNMKNLMTTILPMVKNIISNKINQIKLGIMQKIPPNKAKKRRNIF